MKNTQPIIPAVLFAIAFLSLTCTSASQVGPQAATQLRDIPSAHTDAQAPTAVAPVTFTMGNWSQMAQLVSEQQFFRNQGFFFGDAVAVSGDTVVVDGQSSSNFEIVAYVFVKPTCGWEGKLPVAALSVSPGGDFFAGISVAVSGDTVVVGLADNSAAYVYVKPAGGWTDMFPTAALTASDGVQGDNFGTRVSISRDTVVVGAPAANSNTGAAYVFVKPSGGWTDMTQTAKLTASDGQPSDDLGDAVSISGNTVVIGAPEFGTFNSGKAYVFVKPANGWVDMTQTAELTASSPQNLGSSISIDAGTVIVGAPFGGVAFVYVQPAGGWLNMTPTATLIPSDLSFFFGEAVAVSGNTVGVSAPYHGLPPNPAQGGVFIFEKPKCDPQRIHTDRESSQRGSVRGPELANCVAAVVGYPDVAAVKSHPDRRCADRERSLRLAVAGTNFAHRAIAVVRRPDVRPVKCQPPRRRPHRERTQVLSVAGPQLGHVVARAARSPDVGPVECHAIRSEAYGERPERGAVAGPQLAHRRVGKVGHPDVGPVKAHAVGLIADSKVRCLVGLVPVQQCHLQRVGRRRTPR